jgi:hypothetical protein
MKVHHILFAMAFFFLTCSCYADITGIVVDAETGQPIEGAVAFVEWTATKGLPGLTHHETYKVTEAETDRNGKFRVPTTYNLLVDPPTVVIYKAGYVAWRNDFIFPGWTKRADFRYGNNIIFRLEQFNERFSHEEHHSFMSYGIIGASSERTPKFNKALGIELEKALREVEKKKMKK